MHVDVRISNKDIVFDFGNSLIVTGPGPSPRPRSGEPMFATTFAGNWAEELRSAQLGQKLTNFIERLADLPGADTAAVYPRSVFFGFEPTAEPGPAATKAALMTVASSYQLSFVGGLPLGKQGSSSAGSKSA